MNKVKLNMSLKTNVFLLPVIIISLTLPATIKADDRSNARSLGMANTSLVSSFGINAFGLNPANYYYNKYNNLEKSKKRISKRELNKPQFEISVFSIGGQIGSDANFNFYEKYRDFLSLKRDVFVNTFTDYNRLLDFSKNILPEEDSEVDFDFELKWFAFNVSFPKFGALNFTVSDKVALRTKVPARGTTLPGTYSYRIDTLNAKGYLTNVELHQQEAETWWYRKYSLGASKVFEFSKSSAIRSISIGFAGALVHGFGHIAAHRSDFYISTYGISYDQNGRVHVDSVKGSQNFNTQASLTDYFNDFADGSRSQFSFFPKPAGTGYSLDFGINIRIGDNVRIAGSVTELGKIRWEYNKFENIDRNNFVYRDFFIDRNDPTYNRFVSDLQGDQTRDTTGHYYTDLPTKFSAGILFQPSDKFLIEFDWTKGNNDQPGNTTGHIISVGSEYIPIEFFSLRAGASVGGPLKYSIGLGAGLKFPYFALDIAANSINHMIMNRYFAFAVSTKLMF